MPSSPPQESSSGVAGRPLAPLLLALAVVVIWGVSFAVTRATIREIPPLTIAFLRFTLAALLFWPLAGGRGRRRIAPGDRWDVFMLGFTGITLYFAFENFGLKYTTASHGALIIATIPLVSELAESRRHRQSPPRPVLAGLLVALAGVFVILGRDEGGGASLAGDLLMIGAVVTWIWYTYIADRLVRRYPNRVITFWIMVVGAVTFLPAALVELALEPIPLPSPAAWGGVVFLGVFCSALAFLWWNRAIPALGIAATNTLLYGLPLVGVLSGVVLLGEPLTPKIALGTVLILGGVIWADRCR